MATGAELLAKLLEQNDPYKTPKAVVSEFTYQPQRAGDEGTALGAALGKIVLGGILDAKQQDFRSEQRRALADYIADLDRDTSALAPEALEGDLADTARLLAVETNIARQQKQREAEQDYARDLEKLREGKRFDLVAAAAANPLLARELTTAIRRRGGLESLLYGNDALTSATQKETPLIDLVEPTEPGSPVLATKDDEDEDPRSEFEKVSSGAYDRTLESTGSEDLAESNAQALLDVMKTQSADLVKTAGGLREQGLKFSRELEGVNKAIEELPLQGAPFQGAISGAARIGSLLSEDKFDDFLEQRATLERLQAFPTQFFRTVGEGVITDREVKNFTKALPSVDKTKEENRVALQRLQNFAAEALALSDRYSELARMGKAPTSVDVLEVRKGARQLFDRYAPSKIPRDELMEAKRMFGNDKAAARAYLEKKGVIKQGVRQ